jgi:ABC-2 type transport system ATP-binding protein
MQKLLELKDISRRVSDRFSLRDVTLAVEPGQIVGFVGANGAGKTTTIRAALGLIKLDAGEVHLFGQRCGADAPDESQRHLRSRVGLVLDTCPFPSTLRVGQIESLVGPAYPTWDRETFAGFINRFGLDPKTKVKDLSRGMGMKLQLACALSHNAKLLVLDEATAGLDPMAREELLDELLAFVADGQHSVLLSSHITSDLDRTADRVICIENGSIIFGSVRPGLTYMCPHGAISLAL